MPEEVSDRFSLVDFSVTPARVKFDGEEYELHPLRMGDYAEAQRWLRDKQSQSFFEHLSGKNRVSDEVWADVLTRIEQTPITVQRLIATPETMYYLVYLSLRRGGSKITLKDMADMLPMTHWQLTLTVLQISGLRMPTEGLEDPFGAASEATPSNNVTALSGSPSPTKSVGENVSEAFATATA